MTEPTRWTEGPSPADPRERRAADALRSIAEEPWDELAQARLRRRFLAVAPERASRYPYWLPAAVVSVLLVLSAAAGWRVHESKSADNLTSHLTSSPGSAIDLTLAGRPNDADHLTVRSGHVAVHGADHRREVALHTPHLDAEVHAATYWVEVAGEQTTLSIESGEAWVGSTVRVHLVEGDSIRSDDPRLAPPMPSPAAAAFVVPTPTAAAAADACSAIEGETRWGCYQREAQGDDAAAQNALFTLGMMEREEHHSDHAAIARWREYQARFPQGPLGPEASFSILAVLVKEHRVHDALGEASSFIARYPADGRGGEVRLAAASLGCGLGVDAAGSLALLGPLLSPGAGSLQGEALFVEGTCLERIGKRSEAREAARAYLAEFPGGPRAAEARARLSGD